MRSLIWIALLCAMPSLAAAQPAAVEPATSGAEGWPSIGLAPPAGVVNPRVEHGKDEGLLYAGAFTFGGSYLFGIGVGVNDEYEQRCGSYQPSSEMIAPEYVRTGCRSWPYAFIPFAGPIVAALASEMPDGSPRVTVAPHLLAMAIFYAASQVAGFAILLFALAGSTEHVVSADLGAGAALTLEPHAPGADAGASLRLVF